MRFADVVTVLVSAYAIALAEPRFQLPGRHNAAEDLILAPVKGTHALDNPGPVALTAMYPVEQFYAAMIDKMMSDLRMCNIGWCRLEIWPEENTPATTVPTLEHSPRTR